MNGHVDLDLRDYFLRQLGRYVNVPRVHADVIACIAQWRTFIPALRYSYNNGIESKILVLHRTMTVKHEGMQYNIPVEVHLSAGYPESHNLFDLCDCMELLLALHPPVAAAETKKEAEQEAAAAACEAEEADAARQEEGRQKKEAARQEEERQRKKEAEGKQWAEAEAKNKRKEEARRKPEREAAAPETHYSVLGIGREATTDEIKTARDRLALQFHPDRNKEAGAEEIMKKVNEAYRVLSDPDAKCRYDLSLRR